MIQPSVDLLIAYARNRFAARKVGQLSSYSDNATELKHATPRDRPPPHHLSKCHHFVAPLHSFQTNNASSFDFIRLDLFLRPLLPLQPGVRAEYPSTTHLHSRFFSAASCGTFASECLGRVAACTTCTCLWNRWWSGRGRCCPSCEDEASE
jgi:hypothetical protein